MNGITASLIISGDKAGLKDVVTIEKKMKLMFRAYGPEVEIVLYFSQQPKFKTAEKNIVLTSSKTIAPFQKAVVVASGEKLVFTTLKNFFADKKNLVLNQALDTKIKSVAAPRPKGLFGKVPYLVASRSFLIKFVAKTHSLGDLLDYAKQKQHLTELLPVKLKLPQSVTKKHLVIDRKKAATHRPNRTSFKTIRFSDNVPVFIICRDRLEPLRQLVAWCEAEGLKNIILIDNDSTYRPLLEYYLRSPYEIIYLNHNVGYLSPWITAAVNIYAKDVPYIVSDADVVPLETAHGAVRLFCQLLNRYPKYVKAGFGLKIDDLPDGYKPKPYVISFEKQYWQKEIEKDVYDAPIDTTFALWRPNLSHTWGPSLRTGGRYMARHVTWYIDSSKPSREMKYYRDHVDKVVNTWSTEISELPKLYIKQKLDNQRSR